MLTGLTVASELTRGRLFPVQFQSRLVIPDLEEQIGQFHPRRAVRGGVGKSCEHDHGGTVEEKKETRKCRVWMEGMETNWVG